jgi:large subunit ribosomal protein L24
MNKIKKGDEVIVIAGKDKGKRGTVEAIVDGGERVLVADINLVTKHKKRNPETGEGGLVKINKPIHRSNVMVYDPTSKKGSRVGIRTLKDGQRVRFLKASDQLIEAKQ